MFKRYLGKLVLAKATNVFAVLVLARSFSKDDFGELNYFLQTTFALVALIFSPLAILLVRNNSDSTRVEISLVDIKRELFWLFVVLLVALSLSPLILRSSIIDVTTSAMTNVIVAIGLLANAVFLVNQGLIQPVRSGATSSAIQLGSSVIFLIAALGLIRCGAGISVVLVAYLYSPLLASAASLKFAGGGGKIDSFAKGYFPLASSSLVHFPISWFVIAVVEHSGGMASVAEFAIVSQIANLIGFVSGSIHPYLLSRYSSLSHLVRRDVMRRDIVALSCVSLAILGAYFPCAFILVEVLLPEYRNVIDIGFLYVAASLFVLLKVPLTAYAQAGGLFWNDVVLGLAGGVAFGLLSALLWRNGLGGVALSRLIAAAAEAVLSVYLIRRMSRPSKD